MSSRPRLRCAIYTRKSTEEGLEQEFNSLDAQREACAAYIASQASLGWIAVANRYDDPGISGGTLERPGLQRLLADLQAKRIDVVVVYKIDRLTRSLGDFAKIVEVFDGAGASFVSVTQQFNTTTSMGRLTLNVLLSFAQFEREVTAERIRDKIAASKKKGIWMGGTVPLGYQVVERKLMPKEPEATFIQHLFDRYADLKSVPKLVREIDMQLADNALEPNPLGFRRVHAGQLYRLLANPGYVGKLRHKDQVHDGEHEGIVSPALFERVQQILADNAVRTRKEARSLQSRHPLNGLIFDETGDRLSPSHSTSNGRRYEYYVSSRNLAKNGGANDGWRLPAAQFQEVLLSTIAAFLLDGSRVAHELGCNSPTSQHMALIERAAVLADRLREPSVMIAGGWSQIRAFVERVEITPTTLGCTINREKLLSLLNNAEPEGTSSPSMAAPEPQPIILTTTLQMKRRGQEARIVMPASSMAGCKPDPVLVDLIARAHLYLETLMSLPKPSIAAVANHYDVHPADVSRLLPLAFIAPSITEAILTGRQPAELTGRRLARIELPMDWAEQRAMLAA
ncbi:recombinase family protein [Shinella sp.]|uniref:recombinase family protein n=1 Tax=Shinella sp. TaxID=1870904 RepID=UPI003F6F5788